MERGGSVLDAFGESWIALVPSFTMELLAVNLRLSDTWTSLDLSMLRLHNVKVLRSSNLLQLRNSGVLSSQM